jgi:threonine dehydratase
MTVPSPHAPSLVPLAGVVAARDRIADRVHRTPTLPSRYLSDAIGASVLLKMELFQKTGSFKARGALNKLATLAPDARARGVVTLSAGNHAQALAWAARDHGIPATVVMPASADAGKVDATRGYGGEVVLTDGDLLDTCLTLRDERGLTLVHPFDDADVIAGQGTVGLEILEDVPAADVIVVPIGGGGLIAGVAAACRALRPAIRIIGVEPEGADVMSRSLVAGSPARIPHNDTVADGLAAPFAGDLTFAHVRQQVDDIVRVSDAAIVDAMRRILERCKVVVEPAGAASVAALLSGQVKVSPGERAVAVLSGGNISGARLGRLMA